MSAPIAVGAMAGSMILLFTSSFSNPLLAVVPGGMWAKASISPLSELAREAGKRSRSAKPIVHIPTGLVNLTRRAVAEAPVLALLGVEAGPGANTGLPPGRG